MGIKSVENIYFTVEIPKGYPPDIRKAIAQEIIDFVVNRTQDGKDKDGKKFKGYSETYSKSLDFKIAGKSKSTVDLTLSSEMLNSMKYLQNKSKASELAIGYLASDSVAGKVEGNVLGTYGNSKPVTRPRDFLGIKENDLMRILKKYPIDDLEAATERADSLNEG